VFSKLNIRGKEKRNMDKFIKRKEILNHIPIKDTKLKAMIKAGKLINPIPIDDYSEELYSLIELSEWMEAQKAKRDENIKGEK
jgi:hypothetical protein